MFREKNKISEDQYFHGGKDRTFEEEVPPKTAIKKEVKVEAPKRNPVRAQQNSNYEKQTMSITYKRRSFAQNEEPKPPETSQGPKTSKRDSSRKQL